MRTETTFALLLAVVSFTKGEDCKWDRDEDSPEFPPLIFDDTFELVRPVLEGDKRIVSIKQGSALTLACPETVIQAIGKESAKAKCVGKKVLSVDGKDWDVDKLGCTKSLSETILKNVDSCGDGDVGTLQKIGFNIAGDGQFYELIRVCFDPVNETTLYSANIVHGANIAAKDVDPSRPSFKSSTGYFTVSMSTVYAQNNQLKLMESLLKDKDLAKKIIDPSKQFYFAKGHMAPDADFVTVPEQDATYYFINAVPQWQAFNNGNWKYLEYATRDLAESHGTDLTVFSGGWGVLELDDINGNPVEIYLGLYQDKKVVPAPALTWKVVYENETQRAAAIVGINNPHITEAPKPLCHDICSSLKWLDFDFEDLVHGYTYCCTVDDLRAAIPHVPDLGDVDLLDN